MPNLKPIIIIPARLGSTRLANKPLADIHGKPMIVHVWEKAIRSNCGPVIVACDDDLVKHAVENAGGKAILTPPHLASGSDRIHYAFQTLPNRSDYKTIVNIQGDLPTIQGQDIVDVLEPLRTQPVDISTLGCPFHDPHEALNPNKVKVCLKQGMETPIQKVETFSRTSHPHYQNFHHIGLYAYRPESLERFVRLPQSPNEKQTRLEQMRAMDAQMRIDVRLVSQGPLGVDTADDLLEVKRILA